jgi:hypothetical protein
MTAKPNAQARARARRYQLTPRCPITVVAGPPAAGKSTYAQHHAGPAEVIVDLDALALALCPYGTHQHHRYPEHIRRAAIAARRGAIDQVAADPACPHLWIIHAHPDPAAVRLYDRWSAKFVVIDPGRGVVMARAKADRPVTVLPAIERWYRSPPLLPNVITLAAAPAPHF